MTDIKRKRFLLTHSMMTPVERRMGRFMRAPDGHEGGDSTGGTDNTGGNSAVAGNESGNQNNGGQTPDLSGFWEDKPIEGITPKTEVDPNAPNPEVARQEQQKAFGTQLDNSIKGLKFDPIFNDQIAEQLAEGNFQGVNEAIQGRMQDAVRQSIMLNTHVMREVVKELNGRFQSMIDDKFGSKENTSSLLEAFPSAKDPKVRPMVEQVFNQSMRHTAGNREQAIKLTRDMLKIMGQTAADDMGLTTPPSGREDQSYNDHPGVKSLVDSLLQRE